MNVKINNLKKYYQDKLILNIKEIEFKENQTYCIRGRNGSGKTTLMQIITQLLSYNTGEIRYNHQMVNKALMKQMTYVSQNPYVFNTTVFENIYYPLKLRNNKKIEIESLIDDYLAYFELKDLKHQQSQICSSGEKMKIALIRSFIFKPQLLCLDEPTTNLDVESIEKLKKKLLELKKHTTIIFISHDLEFIQTLSDKTYLLKDGKLRIE